MDNLAVNQKPGFKPKDLAVLGGAEFSRLFFYQSSTDDLELILTDGYFPEKQTNTIYEGNVIYITDKNKISTVMQVCYNKVGEENKPKKTVICLKKLAYYN